MHLAYLCNHYPAVSHSFIRREIAALEAAGHTVDRLSVRRPAASLPDPADQAEAERTFFILGQGAAALGWAVLALLAARPGRWLDALRLALRMEAPGFGGLVRRCAYFAEACLIVRRFERRPVDHLHAHFGTNPAAVARLVRRLGGPPYSFTAHGPDEFDAPRALDLHGKIAEARAAVAISHFGRSQLMRWSDPADWPRIAVVRCGVDALFLEDVPDAPPPEAPHLCCVGRLSAQKGIPLLIEAAALLKRRGVPFRLTIVGDGELRPAIEAQIRAEGLAGSVVLAGACDGAAVRAHLLDARAFVLPSFAEGLPVVIMEALALRRPVIATAIAGTPELVDEACGWLIPAGSVEALARAMEQALAASPDRLREMGEVGRQRVLDRHDSRRTALELVDFLTAGPADG